MALEIFRLVGSIFVDSDAANESIAKTEGKAAGLAQKLSSGIKTAGAWGAAVLGGASAAAGGLASLGMSAASTADNIDKMSQKLGVSREAYQELDYILGQNGMSVDSLSGGMKKLIDTMQSARDGSSAAAATFDQLGISYTDSTGALKSQEDMLYETIAALQAMDNETERNALANDLFGRSAAEMIPLLNSGAGSMEALREQAHELGLVMGDEMIDAGVQLGDTVDSIKKAMGGLVTRLGASLMPIIQKVADYILRAMPKIEALFAQLEPVLTQVFEQLLPPLLELAEQIFPILADLLLTLIPIIADLASELLPIIVEVLDILLPPAMQIIEQLLPPLLELLEPLLGLLSPLLELLTPILDLVVAIITPIGQLISDCITPLTSGVDGLTSGLGPLNDALTWVSDVLQNNVQISIEMVKSGIDTLKEAFGGITDFLSGVFAGDWEAAWLGLADYFSAIMDGIKETFKIPLNYIIDGINKFIGGLNGLAIPDWVPGVGGKSMDIPTIPRLATGGVLERGQIGLLEGTGAEAVVPLENNRRWIHAVSQDMQSAGIGGSQKAETLLTAILNTLEDISHLGITLDTGAVVGALAGPMDRRLGQIAAQKSRW